jgi:hypothetical protein
MANKIGVNNKTKERATKVINLLKSVKDDMEKEGAMAHSIQVENFMAVLKAWQFELSLKSKKS